MTSVGVGGGVSLGGPAAIGGGGGGVTDHGALTGLADNDHPQYALASDVATSIAGKEDAGAAAAAVAAHAAASDPHPAYATDADLSAHVGAGGASHAAATTGAAGFMSAADKSKLDGVAAGATSTALASTAPAALGASAAVGTGTTAARADHVHSLPTPAEIGAPSTANALAISGTPTTGQVLTCSGAGTANWQTPATGGVSSSRAINTTAPLTGGGDLSADRTLSISPASGVAAGSMSAADFSKLAGLPSSAVPTTRTVSTTAPLAGGGALSGDLTLSIAAATTGAPGTMSAADKAKLDGVAASATNTPLSSTTPAALGAAAVGVGTTAARADHVHALPTPAGIGAVPTSRLVSAGNGLTGGGALSADLALSVAANADGSISVGAGGVQVGVLASDGQHGTRGGGTLHAAAVASGSAGFMSGADKAKLDGLPSSAIASGATAGGDLSGTLPNPTVAKVNGVTVTGTPTSGQVLTATSGTAASWQAPSGGGGVAPPVDARGTVTSSIAVDMADHLAGGKVATATLTSATACAVSATGVPVGRAVLELVITNPASGTVPALTFFAGATLIPATPPPLSTGLGQRTVYTCVTYDQGATWWVYLAGAGL